METRTRNYTTNLAVAILVGVFGLILGKYIWGVFTSNQNSFDKMLVETANQINQNTPMIVDSETRLDSTLALPGKRFAYYFTLYNYTIDEIDAEDFEKSMRPNMLNNLKTSPDMNVFRNNNVDLQYIYRDKNGMEIVNIEINHKDYK
jgi:hypothetical protein